MKTLILTFTFILSSNLWASLPRECQQGGLSCVTTMLDTFESTNERTLLGQTLIRAMWRETLVGNEERHFRDLDCSQENEIRCPGVTPRNTNAPAYGGNREVTYGSRSDRVNHYMNVNEPWSAAFICATYLKCAEQNVDGDWHSDYIFAMIRGTLPGFTVYKRKIALKKGDLLCTGRKSKYKKSSHCDVIVAVKGKVATAIGGNINNTVAKYSIRLNSSGAPITSSSRPFWVIARPN
jgi:hypothetical protein